MTIPSTASEVSYAGDGVSTVFPITFVFDTSADLKVIETDSDGNPVEVTTGFSIAGGDGSLGTLTRSPALPVGTTLTILDDPERTQPTDYVDNDAFPAEVHEDALDRGVRISKRLYQILQRALRFADGDPVTSGELGSVDNRKGKYLFFNAITGAVEYAVSLATTVLSQSIIAQLLNPQTAAETSAGVTPTNYDRSSGYLAETERYHSGTVGNATDDDNAVDAAISVIKESGGFALIPPSFNASMAKPALGLANSESGGLVDLRISRPNSGNEAFGSIDWYFEGRDSSGNYATEFRVLGKQNPAFTAVSLSDGTANGYSRVNYASSFLHKHEGVDQWQYINDPMFGGYYGWAQVYFAGGSGKYAMWCTIDANGKPRYTLAQANLAAATGSITGATNATPIVITTSGAHGLDGVNQPVSISGVGGNTAANGDWEVKVLTSTTFELNGSVGNGSYTSGGTFSGQQGHSRATLNVPKVQGGTEAIYTEGSIASELAHGTAPLQVQSKTVDDNLHARPYIVGPTGTHLVNSTPGVGGAKVLAGTVAMSSGTATVSLSGDGSFSSNTTYFVTATSRTSATACKVTKTNGASFTIECGAGTDNVDYIAVGY